MTGILTLITWAIVLLVVLLLVFYLGGVLLALYRAGNHLARLNRLLTTVGDDTEPFAGRVETINGALSQLRDGLAAINRELVALVRLFSS